MDVRLLVVAISIQLPQIRRRIIRGKRVKQLVPRFYDTPLATDTIHSSDSTYRCIGALADRLSQILGS